MKSFIQNSKPRQGLNNFCLEQLQPLTMASSRKLSTLTLPSFPPSLPKNNSPEPAGKLDQINHTVPGPGSPETTCFPLHLFLEKRFESLRAVWQFICFSFLKFYSKKKVFWSHFSVISQETDTCGHIRPAEVTQMAFLGQWFWSPLMLYHAIDFRMRSWKEPSFKNCTVLLWMITQTFESSDFSHRICY